MAKLRMTYKNLKALRKSREYQAVLVDLVNESIVPKNTAEALLGYNIPSDLIPKISGSLTTPDDVTMDDESSSSSDEASSSSADDSSSSDAEVTITITVSMIKTIAYDRLDSDTVSSPSSLDSAQSIVVPAGSSGADIFEALQAASIGDLYGISTPAFMTNDSVDHSVMGFNPDTAQLYYTTDTFDENTTIGVFIMQPASDSSSS